MHALRHSRSKAGLSQTALASAAGTSQHQIKRLETGERTLTKDWAERLASHIGTDARTLLLPPADLAAGGEANSEAPGSGRSPPPHIVPNVVVPTEPETIDTGILKGPRNVPVDGSGSSSDGRGAFMLNGQIIDHALRPPGIINRKDAYVVYIVGDSVSPAYEEGSPIYVDHYRRPAPRDYVFVELSGEHEDEDGRAFVKRLIRRTCGKVYLEQHFPAQQLNSIKARDFIWFYISIP